MNLDDDARQKYMIQVGTFELIDRDAQTDDLTARIEEKIKAEIIRYVEQRGGTCRNWQTLVKENPSIEGQVAEGKVSIGVKCWADILPDNLKCVNCGSRNLTPGFMGEGKRWFGYSAGKAEVALIMFYKCADCNYFTAYERPELVSLKI